MTLSNFTDIEPEFKEQLKVLVPLLLSPENLVTKQIGGNRIKAKELLHYFQSYMAIYKGDELPEPKSMLEVFRSLHSLQHIIYCPCLLLYLGHS